MATRRTPKLIFLDGIRGLCALYVALFHAQLFTGYGLNKEQYSVYMKPINYILSFGHYSVSIFIVLSGFSLTIPIVLTAEKSLHGGFIGYISRRSRRILPPYFFALAFSLFLIGVFSDLQSAKGTAWDSKIPVSLMAIVSHIFLIHNFSLEWVNKINGPMWSVATEWQIYFCFPILLAVWRSKGLMATVILAISVSFLPRLLFPLENNLSWLHPWYLGLFSMGMAAAVISFSPELYLVKLRSKINWRLLTYILCIILLLVLTISSKWIKLGMVMYETAVSFVFCVLLIHYTLVESENNKKSRIFSIITSSKVTLLGVFSYSIYLIHSPLLALINLSTLGIEMTSDVRLIFMLFVAIPIAIFCSYVFHLLIERKFMTKSSRKDYQIPNPSLNIT